MARVSRKDEFVLINLRNRARAPSGRQVLKPWRVRWNLVAPQSNAAARFGVLNRQAQAVQLCDGGNEAEPEAAARRMAALLDAVKAAQHDVAIRLGDARPGVGHFNAEPIIPAKNAQRYPAARGGVLDCVVDEVAHGLEQQARVARHLSG